METTYQVSRALQLQRKRQRRAAIIAICTGFAAASAVAWAATMWDKPPSWVPVLAGVAIAIIAYGLIAPES
jgi:hypothetical protein